MKRNHAAAVPGVLTLVLLAGCTATSTPETSATDKAAVASPAGSPSVSAAPSPTGCTEQSGAARQIRALARTTVLGDAHTLTIGAGNALCFPVTLSVAAISFGGPGAPWSHAGYAKYSAGRYAGTAAVVYTMPRIVSPCSGLAVYVGTALAANEPAPVPGVVTGFTVPDGADQAFSQVVALDVLGGPACTTPA